MFSLICEKCGGAINPITLCCEYCETQYKENDSTKTNNLLKNKTEKLRLELMQQRFNSNVLVKINQPKGE